MIPKSGHRFSEKIMLKQKLEPSSDSTKNDSALGPCPHEAASRLMSAHPPTAAEERTSSEVAEGPLAGMKDCGPDGRPAATRISSRARSAIAWSKSAANDPAGLSWINTWGCK